MHSDSAAVPPRCPGPAAWPIAAVASCSVTRSHAVRPPPPPPAAGAVPAGLVAAGAVGPPGAGAPAVTAAGPQPARSTHPARADRVLRVLVAIMMNSLARASARRR